MKKNIIITISRIGYNHPSQANWSYGIYKIDIVNTNQSYCMSYTVSETFGGNDRFCAEMLTLGYKVIETKGVYPSQKCTGIREMQDIESKEFIKELTDFIDRQN
jgi:hypothetical protein